MGYETYLKDLLRPLGVYDLESGSINSGELAAIGAALDEIGETLEHAEREMLLATACDTGLDRIGELLTLSPVCTGAAEKRGALAALLRIGGDSFTPAALNDTLRGCGIRAAVRETGTPGRVEVTFPGVGGEPDGFDRLRPIIEEILPCHLEVVYVFLYITWAQIESRYGTWAVLEAQDLSWDELERQIDGEGG